MRRLLSVLRQGDEELAPAPQPSLRRIRDLVESVRAAGLRAQACRPRAGARLDVVLMDIRIRPEDQPLAAIRVVSAGGSLFAPSVTRRLIEEFAKRSAPAAQAPHPPS
jgi:hypothetical protein